MLSAILALALSIGVVLASADNRSIGLDLYLLSSNLKVISSSDEFSLSYSFVSSAIFRGAKKQLRFSRTGILGS